MPAAIRLDRQDGGVSWVRADQLMRIEPAYVNKISNFPSDDIPDPEACIVVLSDGKTFACKGSPDQVAELAGWK